MLSLPVFPLSKSEGGEAKRGPIFAGILLLSPVEDRLGWEAAKDRIPLVELKSREFRD